MNASHNSVPDNRLKMLPTPSDNFGLTKSEFDAYVKKLKLGDESLFTKVFSYHFHDSVSYVRNKFKISQDRAYDTCMDTMLEFRKKIIAGKIRYGNLRYLYTRMALNNYIDDIKKSDKRQQAINVFMESKGIESIDKQYFFNVIDRVLGEQDTHTKETVHQMFYIGKPMDQMAEESGVSKATMRKRKQRIIDKLKSSFFEILKSE